MCIAIFILLRGLHKAIVIPTFPHRSDRPLCHSSENRIWPHCHSKRGAHPHCHSEERSDEESRVPNHSATHPEPPIHHLNPLTPYTLSPKPKSPPSFCHSDRPHCHSEERSDEESRVPNHSATHPEPPIHHLNPLTPYTLSPKPKSPLDNQTFNALSFLLENQ